MAGITDITKDLNGGQVKVFYSMFAIQIPTVIIKSQISERAYVKRRRDWQI